jgi:thiol-disulfide isomerase/thioredoxin
MSAPSTQPTSARWKGWLRDAVIILVIILAVRAWQHQDVVTGEPPALAGISLTGQPIALSDFAGQPLLIHFFAPWCPVCVFNHDNITHISKHYPVLMIVVQTEPDELEQWLNDHPEDNPALMMNDPDGRWLAAFGAKALPTSVFINANGKISTTELGYISTIGLWFRFLTS